MPLRLPQVKGFENRINDIIFKPALYLSRFPQTLVYFGGDVQDYPEKMHVHPQNKKHIKWNLENTASILGDHFPHSHIIVVKPVRMEHGTLSCYDNFVVSDSNGVPDHMPNYHALVHLERLLANVNTILKSLPHDEVSNINSKSVEKEKNNEEKLNKTRTNDDQTYEEFSMNTKLDNEWAKQVKLHEYPLTLVGFSKGCVVLNQILHEFHHIRTFAPDHEIMRFIVKIKNMYWLDGGHSGGKDTWVTSSSVLETFSQLDLNTYIHVSPYQVHDDSRPWIGREEKIFSRVLTQLKARVKRYLHGKAESPGTLKMHFQVLTDFVHVQNSCSPTNITEVFYEKR